VKSKADGTMVRSPNGPRVNRRNFLKGAGTVAIGLPFLEGLPERSAWAASSPPVFSFFIVAQNGVVFSGGSSNTFFPPAVGAISSATLTGDTIATSPLAAHAPNLLFIKGINYPQPGPQSCGHAEGCTQTLTGVKPGMTGNKGYSGGPSADTVIAKAVNAGAEPLALYSGTKGFIAERISFKAAGSGQLRGADVNPYLLYSKVVGLTTTAPTTGGGTVTTTDPVAVELANTRKSVNDLVRAEMNSLLGNSALSSADKTRLKQHFDAIRDTEIKMNMAAGAVCSTDGITTSKYDALKSGFAFKGDNGGMDDTVKMHLQIVAIAFACGYNRTGTLQWGDGTDGTKYPTKTAMSLGWPFHQISHRIMSDSASGSNPTAELAHHEIDLYRMQTLAAGLDVFKAHGLADKAAIVWTNSIADGPSHSTQNVPMIIWGSAGGALKQGTYIDAAKSSNDKILNTIIQAVTKDASTPATLLGGGGTFAGMMA